LVSGSVADCGGLADHENRNSHSLDQAVAFAIKVYDIRSD
jgi:hypothetical protein